jgi:Zn-dependent M28 family amino/carboxypeptidase
MKMELQGRTREMKVSLKLQLRRNLLLFVCTVMICLGGASAQNQWTADARAWWTHVQFLAADNMQGRLTGSKEYQKAAEYVAKQFSEAGLQPAGTNGYLQPIQFEVKELDEPNSSLELVLNGKPQKLKLGDDATLRVAGTPAKEVHAEAVFVGYGFSVPEMKYDELAGLNLRGKIAVYLTGGPSSIPGPLKAHYQSTAERWAALKRAGAIGLVTIGNPKSSDIPWERASLARFQASMDLADPQMHENEGMQFSANINPAKADEWLTGTGQTIAELLAAADADKPLPKFNLRVVVNARVTVKQSTATAPNVVGVFQGSDPKLKDEYVVISAHLDHVGVGEPIKGDRIYNGAMDNASGVASVIEIAKHLKASGMHPKRSILFLAVAGEEKGMLGSRYFVAHPTVNRKQIVADINMDMFLPLFALHYLEVQGLDESSLGADIRAIAEPLGITIQADKEPQRNRFIRSDQYSFVRAGIPALAFKFGWVKGSEEEKVFQEWVRVNYHAPSDDLDQPVDTIAAAQFNKVLLMLAEHVADADTRPTWNSTSFFKRFAE